MSNLVNIAAIIDQASSVAGSDGDYLDSVGMRCFVSFGAGNDAPASGC